MITIAHRLRTVQDADLIVVMGDGKAVQCGPPAELLQDVDGLYYEMFHTLLEGEQQRIRRASTAGPWRTPPANPTAAEAVRLELERDQLKLP